MKKSILLIVCIFLVGCTNKSKVDIIVDDVQGESYQNYKDCTAEVINSIEINENAMYSMVRREACFSHIYTDVCDLYPNSENIVAGKVVDITYSDDNASAYTYCTFAVDEVLKGDEIEKESLITVSLFQGYCRISKYAEVYGNDHFQDFDMSKADSTYFIYAFDGEPLVQEGEEFVLFLGTRHNDENVTGDYYVPIGTYMGRYQLNEDGYYERFAPEEDYYVTENNRTRSIQIEQPMTLEQMKDAINVAESLN